MAVSTSRVPLTKRSIGSYLLMLLLWGGGALLFAWLLAHHGVADLKGAAAAMGWGLLAIAGFHIVPLLIDAIAWRGLMRPAHRPALAVTTMGRWIAEAVNALLPTISVGGEFARARIAAAAGVPGAEAGASVIVDVTLGLMTQLPFTLLGLLLLQSGPVRAPGDLAAIAGIGLIALSIAAVTLVALQMMGTLSRLGRVLARRLGGGRWDRLVGSALNLDAAIGEIYRRRRDLLWASVWRLLGWLTGAGEVWLALQLLGQPISPANALMMESLIQAVRTGGFLVPAGLGLQEGAILLLAGIIGLPADTALAFALVRRARELLLGGPALLAWQIREISAARAATHDPEDGDPLDERGDRSS
jgi:putative membrane protein